MNNYVTGKIIKNLREKSGLTQNELAEKLFVSNKTVSKWENGKGFPDVSLIEPIATALNVSVIELLNGEQIENKNKPSNMLKSKFSVCPVCGNVIFSIGENLNSCCGITLPSLECEEMNESHEIVIKKVENELYVSLNHEMTKIHYIPFIAYVTNSRVELIKLYPEQNCEERFFNRGKGYIYAYCNKHGLFKFKI